MPTRPTQLRIPPELLAQIDQAAEEKGLTRTAWLLQAAKAQLPKPLAHEVPESGTYVCPRGCEHEAMAPVRCNFCRSQLVPRA